MRQDTVVSRREEPGGLDRRALLERTALGALGATGLYELLEGFAAAPARAARRPRAAPPEQHVVPGLRVIVDNGVEVLVPPLHHQVVTARLRVDRGSRALADARRALAQALERVERELPLSPGGLVVTVAWGAPYFRRYLLAVQGRRFPDYLPRDLVASAAAGRPVAALLDAVRFPSDPSATVLEQNDVAFVFQSDSLAHVGQGATAVLQPLRGLLRITSIRKGFVGGGFSGGRGLPKAMAMRARIPGAESIPDDAQLFLGFTSTQRGALGPTRIANFETLPRLTDQWPRGAFRHGTTMHLSHVFEDLDLWYGQFDQNRRMWQAFDAGRAELAAGARTLPSGPADVQSMDDILRFAIPEEGNNEDGGEGIVGHSASMHPVNRLVARTRDNYGDVHRAGTAILQRSDFNTLDNPFFWSARPRVDRQSRSAAAGLHFIAFSPTSDLFHRIRQAMDGRYRDGTSLPLGPHSHGMGMNSVLRTTHRQNFLVPPRSRRSFPLSELFRG